jgi:hypothetical protein
MNEVLKQMVEALEYHTEQTRPILKTKEAIQAGKKAIAELESQEPVAWTLLLTGEHAGMVGKAGEKFVGAPDYYQRVNVYTHPPQRTWVGLTDDEHCDIWYKESLDWMEYGKAVEAKLKEKNT